MSSKGQMGLQALLGAGMAIVMVGLVVAFGASINNQIGKVALPMVQIKCEAITWASNGTWMNAANPYIYSLDYMYNGSVCGVAGTASQLVKSGVNYTLSNDGKSIYLNITSTDNEMFGSGIKYVNYTTWNFSEASGKAKLTLENSSTGMSSLAGWLPVLAVIIAAGALIGILMVSFRIRPE